MYNVVNKTTMGNGHNLLEINIILYYKIILTRNYDFKKYSLSIKK